MWDEQVDSGGPPQHVLFLFPSGMKVVGVSNSIQVTHLDPTLRPEMRKRFMPQTLVPGLGQPQSHTTIIVTIIAIMMLLRREHMKQ